MTPIDRPWRLLLVDDDEDDYIITRDLLRDSAQAIVLDWCSDFQEGFSALLREKHDLYLIDYRIGAESGLELLRQAVQAGVSRPVILLTGQGDMHLEASAIEQGAADYLVKGRFDAEQLVRSVRYAIDRSLATARIAESEARYRLLFDANPEPMWVFSRQTLSFLAVNQATSRFFGYSQAELLGMSILEVRSEAERSRFLDYFESYLSVRVFDSSAGVWTYRHKSGREVLAEILVHDFEFDQQPCYLVLAIDVTEKQAAREQARKREHAFRQLLNDTRDAVLVISSHGEVCFANPAAEAMLQLKLQELQQWELPLPPHEDRLIEWSLPLSAGGFVDVEIHSSETDWEGEPARLLTLRDITDRKTAERQLRLLQRSLEASYNGVVIVDAQASDMPIIYANPAFERITGYAPTEVIGKNCRFLQGPDRDPLQSEEIRRGLSQARDVHVVVRNFRRDGQAFWNDLYISPIFDERGVVSHFVGVQNDISERKRFEEELSFNGSHDLLTGLPNRALLEDRLRQGCKICQRYHRRLAVLFIDLDGFKPINDSIGHGFGDLLLVEVAKRMSAQVRPGDTVARMGGDEFIVLLPDLAVEDDVVPIADRLIDAISQPYRIQEIDLHVTASIGITLSDGTLEQPLQLIQQADLAMYKAKQEGRNNYQWYTNDLNLRVGERVSLRNELQKALDSGALELYYQPQVDSRSGRVVGLEALLRWFHPTLGYIPPTTFIPVAEDTGQIIPLSAWVLDTACRQIRLLIDKGMAGPSVAVNVSPVHFLRRNFVESIQAVLEKYELEAHALELEITETVLLNNPEKAIETLRQVKELGVGIAIDDFGTGFSSLNYLKRLPIDKVKIDRSFIQEIISDRDDAAITQGIISMAHHLRLIVIAEGVETEPQCAFLRKSQCDQFQGYYFAKPMPFVEIEQYLRQRMLVREPITASVSEEPVQTVLLLDDEENILRALARVLRRDGYRILMATRAQDAFELLAKHDVQVILSDQRMPEMNGTEFLSHVKSLYPNTMRIVLSGYTDLKSVTEAINEGAIYKFLTKPWDDDLLRKDVAQAFRELKLDQAR